MGGIGSGGFRNNAGRKSIDGDPRTKISLTLPTWLLSLLRDEAERQKCSASQLITDILIKHI